VRDCAPIWRKSVRDGGLNTDGWRKQGVVATVELGISARSAFVAAEVESDGVHRMEAQVRRRYWQAVAERTLRKC